MLNSTTLLRSLTLLAAVMVPALAHAQDQRLRVSLGGATTAGALDAQPAIAASVGYRFADRFSFDVEVTAADGAAGRLSGVSFLGAGPGRAGGARLGPMMGDIRRGTFTRPLPAGISARIGSLGLPLSPGEARIERDGNTALATVGFRYELPTQVGRFLPYVSAGLGLARTEQRVRGSLSVATTVRPGITTAVRPIVDIDETTSHTGLAASAGVGASIRIFRQLSADVDARYFRLDRGGNLGRFGGGVSYRF